MTGAFSGKFKYRELVAEAIGTFFIEYIGSWCRKIVDAARRRCRVKAMEFESTAVERVGKDEEALSIGEELF